VSDVPGADDPHEAIGWGRAFVSALAILVLGGALLVYVPNWLLTHLTSMSRSGRVAIVTSLFFVVFFAFAWGLRRLQARGII
jgi:hypothetical protein